MSVVFFFACRKDRCENPIPQIEYKDFIKYTDSAKLVISFIDCDGDIGLTQEDTTEDYQYNLFLEYYEKQEGKWVKIEPLVPFYYRIPLLNESGTEEMLQGDIEVVIKPYYYNRFSNYDTLRYSVMLKDRALHESNIIYTPEIIKP